MLFCGGDSLRHPSQDHAVSRNPIDLLPVSVIERMFGGHPVSSQIEGFDDFHVFDASLPDDRGSLASLGVVAASDSPNFIIMRRQGSGKANFKLNFQKNSSDNVIVIGSYYDQTIFCAVKGNRNTAIYCDLIKSKTNISLRGNVTVFLSEKIHQSIKQIFLPKGAVRVCALGLTVCCHTVSISERQTRTRS